MPPRIKLTYFDMEAAGEPVRLALALSKTPFEDIRVGWDEWSALKPTLPNGQLPVMTIDDGPLRTQSMAMLRWAGTTLSETLYPREKLFDIEEAIAYADDIYQAFAPAHAMGAIPEKFGYPENFNKTNEGQELIRRMREKYVNEQLPTFLKRLSDMISLHGGKWLVSGDEPTIADCYAIPILRGFTRGFIDFVNPNCLDAHPIIVQYIQDFCALKEVKGRYKNGIF